MREATIHCVGRLAVDLYGEQLGADLTAARSFRRSVGGSSANVAIGLARLGRNVALVSRVGDDPMGAYLRAALAAEGVDCAHVGLERGRRTALALLGLGHAEVTGLDFYRENAADAETGADDLPDDALEGGAIVSVCGTQLVAPSAAALSTRLAASEGRIVLDIDLRRPLWEAQEGGMAAAADRLQPVAERAAIVVGNEDEFRALGGSNDLDRAMRAVRERTAACLVLKVGSRGAIAFEGAIPARLDDGVAVPGYDVPLVNPVGAGDAFLAGLLDAWSGGASVHQALIRGNACGALVVSRPGCSDALPYVDELAAFMRVRDADAVEVVRAHRLGGRPERPARIRALACDHRAPFEELIGKHGRDAGDAARFKSLVAEAARRADRNGGREGGQDGGRCGGINGIGLLMDATFGASVMAEATARGWWLGRPVEVTRSRPLAFEADRDGDLAADIARWHPHHVAKCLVWHSPDDPVELIERQIGALRRLQAACRASSIEWMLEVIAPEPDARTDDASLRSVGQLYDMGLEPDWWKLSAFAMQDGWDAIGEVLARRDPACRGVVVLGLDGPLEEVTEGLRLAGRQRACAGFAVGRTIFGAAMRDWFAGTIDDEAAIAAMTGRYATIVDAFDGVGNVTPREATLGEVTLGEAAE